MMWSARRILRRLHFPALLASSVRPVRTTDYERTTTMKRTLSILALATLIAIPSLRAAEDAKDAKAATSASAIPAVDADKMEKEMKAIDVIYKKLPRRVKNAEKNPESLELLAEM